MASCLAASILVPEPQKVGDRQKLTPEYWKIWIDYNRDGDFTDTGENVFSNCGAFNYGEVEDYTLNIQ